MERISRTERLLYSILWIAFGLVWVTGAIFFLPGTIVVLPGDVMLVIGFYKLMSVITHGQTNS